MTDSTKSRAAMAAIGALLLIIVLMSGAITGLLLRSGSSDETSIPITPTVELKSQEELQAGTNSATILAQVIRSLENNIRSLKEERRSLTESVSGLEHRKNQLLEDIEKMNKCKCEQDKTYE